MSVFEGRKGEKINGRRTICEIHREIYDLCVIHLMDNTQLFDQVVGLLEEAFITGVKMTHKLLENKLNQNEIFIEKHPSVKQIENRKERNRLINLKKEMEDIMEENIKEEDTYVKLQSTELRREFSKFSQEQLSDYNFLATFIRNKVGVSLNRRNLARTGVMPIEEYDKMKCWRGLNAKQYPDELANFLVFIYKNRDKIKSYCEIGVADGGTFFVIDSFLRAINEDMGPSVGIDTNNKCAKSFKTYIYQNPNVKFLNIKSVDFKPDMIYDLCFIDANHSFKASKVDYENMKEFSRYIAFHDIHLLNGGVKDLWKTIEGDKVEFLNEDKDFPDPVGIGIIL